MPLVHFKRQRNCERAVAALYREPMLLALISGCKRRPVPALAHRHWGTDPERDGAELPEPEPRATGSRFRATDSRPELVDADPAARRRREVEAALREAEGVMKRAALADDAEVFAAAKRDREKALLLLEMIEWAGRP